MPQIPLVLTPFDLSPITPSAVKKSYNPERTTQPQVPTQHVTAIPKPYSGQARGVGTLFPPPKSQHIFKTAWSLQLLLWDFSLYVFSIQKSSVPPVSPHVCCHGNHATFQLIFDNTNFHSFSSISV